MKIEAPRYIDVPEVGEVFVDRLRFVTFDGHQLRMEFDVIRRDGASGETARQWAYTACRLVVSANGVPDLLDQMSRLSGALRNPQSGASQALQVGQPDPKSGTLNRH